MLRLHYLSINSTSLLIRCTNVALFVYIRFTNLLIVWTLYSVIQLETNATNVVTCWSLAKKFNWAFLYYNIYNSSTVTLHTSNITHANEDQFHVVDGNPKNQTVSVKDLFKSLKNFQEGLPFLEFIWSRNLARRIVFRVKLRKQRWVTALVRGE